ncbi:hypothetical protein [Nocardia brevicatena]|uniref:hypothetical protein n=1 Tax=Nocardia brevicatena TaxID=37327 RepID=UPI0002FF74B0|nr:hypothetical protein [Nocardia brevicatena]
MVDSADVDPPYALERERFDGYTHQEIWEAVQALDSSTLGRTAAAWQASADTVAEAFQTFADTTDREFGRWSGRTAQAAWQATREFIRVGRDTQEVCRALQRLMEGNSDAAQKIRAAIAAPEPYRPLDDPAAEAVHGGIRRMNHDTAAAEATAEAQDTMTYIYTPTIPASGDRVPRFPAQPEPGGSPRR